MSRRRRNTGALVGGGSLQLGPLARVRRGRIGRVSRCRRRLLSLATAAPFGLQLLLLLLLFFLFLQFFLLLLFFFSGFRRSDGFFPLEVEIVFLPATRPSGTSFAGGIFDGGTRLVFTCSRQNRWLCGHGEEERKGGEGAKGRITAGGQASSERARLVRGGSGVMD